MIYWTILKSRGEVVHHYEYLLDGIFPLRVLELTSSAMAHELDLCRSCPLDSRAHLIEEEAGTKYCPVLFHDVVKPSWKLSDLA